MRAGARRAGPVAAGLLAAHLLLGAFAPALALASARNGLGGLVQVLAILPPVLLLVALFDSWMPRERVARMLGPGSGPTGMALALVLGSFAAGPLYAAFPVGQALLRKGCRTANLVLFLGAWATIKLPMLLLESAFLGLRFATLRLALTLPGLVACGLILERAGRWAPVAPDGPGPAGTARLDRGAEPGDTGALGVPRP